MNLLHRAGRWLTLLLLTTYTSWAQTPTVEMADQLRADGKIWVVVAVIATVFAGIIVYLIRLDGKIGRLENEFQANRNKTQDTRIKTQEERQ